MRWTLIPGVHNLTQAVEAVTRPILKLVVVCSCSASSQDSLPFVYTTNPFCRWTGGTVHTVPDASLPPKGHRIKTQDGLDGVVRKNEKYKHSEDFPDIFQWAAMMWYS